VCIVDLTILFQGLTAAGAVIAGVALLWIAIELAGARTLISTMVANPHKPASSHTFHPTHARGGFGIYIYRSNRWELESDLSAPGYEPSPPTFPGAFEGHVVKKESWPSA
jgi:hypothetical protein